MADDLFDKKKIIATLRAQGIPDKDIEKLYGPLPKPLVNSAKANAHRAANAWKYDNKHKRPVRAEDVDPDYEPIEELQKKTTTKKPSKPRISKKKPKPKPKPVKNDWNAASEARLKALYEAGYTTEEIATEFKTSKDAITGKLSRMRKAGWKGSIGTTHAPLPKPAISPKEAAKLSPGMKRFLASTLETNFGAVGRFFSKKWGLIDDKKYGGSGGGSSVDVTAAVIKSNEMVMTALTKLDTSLKRSTSMLTKSIAMSTSKMTEAIANTIELLKKNGASGVPTSGATGGSSTSGGGTAAGIIAALAGGAALSTLFSSRSDASTNSNDMVDSEGPDGVTPKTSEERLRALGAPDPNKEMPSEIEIKVKELSFEADDITFEADEFKFTNKNSGSSGSGSGGAKGGGKSGAESDGPGSSGTSKPSAGMFNNLLDKLGMGGGGSGGINSLADALTGSGGGGAGGGGKSPIPSNDEMAAKDKAWWGGKNGGGGKGGGPAGGPTGAPEASGSLAEQRKRFTEELKNDPSLRETVRAMASAEEGGGAGNSEARKAVIETMMNRASAYGKTLGETVRNSAYYQPYQNGSFDKHLSKIRGDADYSKQIDGEIDEALGGSNRSNYALHNGSAGVAASASRDQSVGWTAPNGEVFSAKDQTTPEAKAHHGAGTAKIEGGWRQNAKAADQAAALAAAKNEFKPDPELIQKGGPVADGGYGAMEKEADDNATVTHINVRKPKDASMLPQEPSKGSQLLEQQKESDSDKATSDKNNDSGINRSDSDKRSSIDDGGNDQTSLLETEGPNHFSDYPMSDQGVGA